MDKDSSYTTHRKDARSLRASICLSQSALTASLTTSHSAWTLVAHQQAHRISDHSHRDHTRQDLLHRTATATAPSHLPPIHDRRTSRLQVAVTTIKPQQTHSDISHISHKTIWLGRLRKEE